MSRELVYLDSSAIVKLVVSEPETPALLSFLRSRSDRVSSALARVEVSRAIRRARLGSSHRRRAFEVLERIALIRIDEGVLDRAAELEPADLRSLDAIHLATALSLEPHLAGIVTYDRSFAAAARKTKLPVHAPR